MLLVFILFFLIVRWYTSKHLFVALLLSYWMSFLVFLICISSYCNDTGDSIPSIIQQLIILTVLGSLIIFTFGMIYIIAFK